MSATARARFCDLLAETFLVTNGDADLTFEITFEAFRDGYPGNSPPAISVYEELGRRC
jgi:hypothetical protein